MLESRRLVATSRAVAGRSGSVLGCCTGSPPDNKSGVWTYSFVQSELFETHAATPIATQRAPLAPLGCSERASPPAYILTPPYGPASSRRTAPPVEPRACDVHYETDPQLSLALGFADAGHRPYQGRVRGYRCR